MGHIKEPKGIDFIIQSRALTKSEELAISEHIQNYKQKNSKTALKIKHNNNKVKAQLV